MVLEGVACGHPVDGGGQGRFLEMPLPQRADVPGDDDAVRVIDPLQANLGGYPPL